MDYLQEAQLARASSGSKTNKVLLFMIFGVLFIIVFVIVYLIFTGGDKNVSDRKMIEGSVLEVGEKDSIQFKINEEDHDITIDFVGLDSVDFTLYSEPIKINLKLNEAKEVDLNGDVIPDLRVKLVKINNKKATIAIQKMEQSICQEFWKCSEWTNCIKGVQIRDCRDLNRCGTPFNKPLEVRDCVDFGLVEDNGALNNTNNFSLEMQNINSSNLSISNFTNYSLTINLTNLTNTTSSLSNNPTNILLNTSVIEQGIINCNTWEDNYQCIIHATETCRPAFLNYTYTIDTSDVPQYSFLHIEIKGNASDGRCLYYEKQIQGIYSIYQVTQSDLSTLIFNEKICKDTKEHLTYLFNRWREGVYSDYDFANVECYPHDNFDCKLDIYDELPSGIYLSSNSPSAFLKNVTLSVVGFSNASNVFWEVENLSVIRLSSNIGGVSTVYPVSFGSTAIIVRDVSLDDCRLRIPFDVLLSQWN